MHSGENVKIDSGEKWKYTVESEKSKCTEEKSENAQCRKMKMHSGENVKTHSRKWKVETYYVEKPVEEVEKEEVRSSN